jgi:putative ABC transport system permease protein
VAGYAGAIVAPDTLTPQASSSAIDAPPPRDRVLVSVDGGVFDPRETSLAAADAVTAAVRNSPSIQVEASKAIVLDAADRDRAAYTELFGALGVFSALAGVLLLVNLFVMLAEERRTEPGTLRALGLTRRRLAHVVGIEGAVYAAVASVLGAAAGIGVGWVVAVAADAFGFVEGGGAFRLVVAPVSVALGATIGLIISLVTVRVTSVRIARLTVAQAIRDLPSPASPGPGGSWPVRPVSWLVPPCRWRATSATTPCC